MAGEECSRDVAGDEGKQEEDEAYDHQAEAGRAAYAFEDEKNSCHAEHLLEDRGQPGRFCGEIQTNDDDVDVGDETKKMQMRSYQGTLRREAPLVAGKYRKTKDNNTRRNRASYRAGKMKTLKYWKTPAINRIAKMA